MDNRKPYTMDRVVRLGITAGVIVGIVWLLSYLSDILIPFAVALLLAYLIDPLVRSVQKWVKRRGMAVALSLVIVLSSLTLLGWLIIPSAVNEVARTGRLLSDLVTNSEMAEMAARRLPPDLWRAIVDFARREDVQEFFRADNFWKLVQTVGSRVLPGVWGLITGTANFFMALIGLSVIGLYLVFLLLDYQKVGPAWRGLIPPAYRETVVEFVEEFDAAMNRFFRAQATVAVIVGVLHAIGFWLIGLPMGILLGLFVGLLNMVPYLQLIGFIPALMLSFIHSVETGTSFWIVIAMVVAVFAVVQAIQEVVLVPRIMGKVTGLSPAIILLSLSVWGKLLGFFGLLIAIPMTCLILAYYRRFLAAASMESQNLGE